MPIEDGHCGAGSKLIYVCLPITVRNLREKFRGLPVINIFEGKIFEAWPE